MCMYPKHGRRDFGVMCDGKEDAESFEDQREVRAHEVAMAAGPQEK